MNFFLTDPKSKQPSVSLTLLIISFLALLCASLLHISKITDSTSSLMELFVTTASLYFGRRVNVSKTGSSMDSLTTQEPNK